MYYYSKYELRPVNNPGNNCSYFREKKYEDSNAKWKFRPQELLKVFSATTSDPSNSSTADRAHNEYPRGIITNMARVPLQDHDSKPYEYGSSHLRQAFATIMDPAISAV